MDCRSLLDIAKADVEEESLETVIASMVNTAGVAHKVLKKELPFALIKLLKNLASDRKRRLPKNNEKSKTQD